MQTINYLQKNGLNPPPYKYLPQKHIYNVNYTRAPGENPINPLTKYEDIIENKGGINVYYPVNHHFPNFAQDPNSSAILSQRIITNPGLNEVPTIDVLRRKFIDEQVKANVEAQANAQILNTAIMRGEGGTKVGSWWSAFVRRYKNQNKEYPPITYEEFKILFGNTKKYNYEQMLNKILNVPTKIIKEEIIHPQENKYDKLYGDILNRCENRTDKFIDHLLNMKQPYQVPQKGYVVDIPQKEFIVDIPESPQKPSNIPPPPPPSNAPKPPPMPTLSKEEKEAMQKRKDEAQKKKQEPSQEEGPVSLSAIGDLVAEAARKRMQQKGIQAEGRIGGYAYAHNFRVPLYMNENLPIPKLQQNEMHLYPQTASSYASDYQWRGYGPHIPGVHISNAPLVFNGEIMP